MNVTLPYDYAQPRQVGRTVQTCRLVRIGIAHQPKTNYARSTDEALLQGALLDPRTSRPRPLLCRIAGALWRWC